MISATSLSRRLLRLHGVNPAATFDRSLTEVTAQAWIAEFSATGPRRSDIWEVAPVERSPA